MLSCFSANFMPPHRLIFPAVTTINHADIHAKHEFIFITIMPMIYLNEVSFCRDGNVVCLRCFIVLHCFIVAKQQDIPL